MRKNAHSKEYRGNPPPSTRIYCNTCCRTTNHSVKATEDFSYDCFDGALFLGWEAKTVRLIICDGCDTPTIETCWTASGMTYQDDKQLYYATYVPNRREGHISPRKFIKLPAELSQMFEETITAYNNDQNMLCAIGLRALVEGICADKKIKGSNLYQKITAMTKILPQNILECLHSFRFMGNVAAHELTGQSSGDLKIAIDVIMDILNFLYDLDYMASQLPADPRQQKVVLQSESV